MNIRWKSQFMKDYKRMMKQGKPISELDDVIIELAIPNPLPEKYHDHFLIGNYKGCKECHIQPDWLLIYDYETIENDEGIKEQQLLLIRTGSHSDLLE